MAINSDNDASERAKPMPGRGNGSQCGGDVRRGSHIDAAPASCGANAVSVGRQGGNAGRDQAAEGGDYQGTTQHGLPS
jgi:hypothetical protein